MKTTELMKLDPALWGGLNQPDLTVDQANAAVFSIAWDGSVSFRAGETELLFHHDWRRPFDDHSSAEGH